MCVHGRRVSFFLVSCQFQSTGDTLRGRYYCDIIKIYYRERVRLCPTIQCGAQEETSFSFFRLRVYGHRFPEYRRRVFGGSALPVSPAAPRRTPVLVHYNIITRHVPLPYPTSYDKHVYTVVRRILVYVGI